MIKYLLLSLLLTGCFCEHPYHYYGDTEYKHFCDNAEIELTNGAQWYAKDQIMVDAAFNACARTNECPMKVIKSGEDNYTVTCRSSSIRVTHDHN